jgi:pimeloyl-ACP methyl ester carboxylesterase
VNHGSAVLFLAGNGHDPVRLEPVRAVLEREERFELVVLEYASVETFDALLESLESQTRRIASKHDIRLVYATGIGALVALALRARGSLQDWPLVLQGGVLWGLEQRWFPRIMRIGPMPRLLAFAFGNKLIRARFAAKHLNSERSPEFLERFFEGYRDARAFENWFRWLTPALLRHLEQKLIGNPPALANIQAWWGEHDHVVGPEELRVTERALNFEFQLRRFAGWGHYPMIDDPEGWTREVSDVLEKAGALS